MLGIRYLKSPATVYVQHLKGGRLRQEGPGLSFFYYAPTSVIVQVPISSVDVPFAFTETTSDFQDVTVQGNLTYRVNDPVKLAGLLDYSIDPNGRYRSDDPSKLGERLVQAAQTGARAFLHTQPLRAALIGSAALVEAMRISLAESATLTQLGVQVLEIAITTIDADPEMSRALQAEAREQLLKEADEAMYARRNTSVELERTIRENELQTEKVVAQRQREVRETQMEAEIAVEQQRATLVETRVENERKEAAARGDALRAVLDPVREVDWRVLLAMQGDADSSTLISSAFDQLAQRAEKIGSLNISPELLEALTRRERD
jgi:regulator of protease activity HflC (stomatin/prohibitin superfamily)